LNFPKRNFYGKTYSSFRWDEREIEKLANSLGREAKELFQSTKNEINSALKEFILRNENQAI